MQGSGYQLLLKDVGSDLCLHPSFWRVSSVAFYPEPGERGRIAASCHMVSGLSAYWLLMKPRT